MSEFEPKPYHSFLRGHTLIESVPAKVYFLDMLGRKDPEIHEWGASGIGLSRVTTSIERALSPSHKGVPHIVTSFPHFTRAYRFGNPGLEESETNVYHAGLWKTNELDSGIINPLERESAGCLGEIEILAQEIKFWAESQNVEEYLKRFAENHDLRVEVYDKLRREL